MRYFNIIALDRLKQLKARLYICIFEIILVPSPPLFSIDNQRTSSSTFHGRIFQNNGGNDRFTIHCNGIELSNVNINGSEYVINNLKPGTRYRCHASTTFCNHISEETIPQQECTSKIKEEQF